MLPVIKPRPRRFVIGDAAVELLPRHAYEARFRLEHPVVGFAFEVQRGEHAFASDRVHAFTARPNGLALVPAGCSVFSRSATGGEYLRIEWNGDFKAHHAEPFSNAVDAAAIRLAHELRRRLLAESMPDAIESEALVRQLVDRTLAWLENPAPPRGARSMTSKRLRRALDWIETELHRSFSVTELASTLGLSVRFFSGAFTAAVGQPPHEFVIDRRLARVREQLRRTDLSLAEIALSCGFASHAHLTTTFRRRLGVTPATLRKAERLRREPD